MAVILLVEDELHVRLFLSEILRNLNHDIRSAPTAASGIDAFMSERPDVVVLDIMLPDASGTAVLDQMRKLRPDVPVVMMSGHADENLAQAVRSRGAFEYLAKPFSVDRFVRVVNAALE